MDIKEFILKNKKLVIVISILVFVLFLGSLLSGGPQISEPTIQDPKTSPFEPKQDTNTLELLLVTPPSRGGNSIDTYQIVSFDFAQEINPDSVDYITRPYIKLKVLYNPDIPKRISFVPQEEGWQHNVLYKLTIRELRGVDGEQLKPEIIYDYYNNPPSFDDYIPPL